MAASVAHSESVRSLASFPISLARRLYFVIPEPEIDGIQIIFQNHVLGIFPLGSQVGFQLKCQIPFLEITLKAVDLPLVHPVGKYIVFQQLLGDGTSALGKLESVGDSFGKSPHDTADVDAIVFVKTFIFDGGTMACCIFSGISEIETDIRLASFPVSFESDCLPHRR